MSMLNCRARGQNSAESVNFEDDVSSEEAIGPPYRYHRQERTFRRFRADGPGSG